MKRNEMPEKYNLFYYCNCNDCWLSVGGGSGGAMYKQVFGGK